MVVALLSLSALAGDPSAVLAAYESVRIPLVADRFDAARAAATSLAAVPGAPPEVAAAATRLTTALDGEDARRAFGEVSRALVVSFATDGAPDNVKVFHCPMTAAWGYWVQSGPGIGNPYMGPAMPTCGEGTSLKAATKAVDSVKP